MSSSKRLFDVVTSYLILPLVCILALPIAIAVLSSLGAPILFSQLRAGLNGNPFRMYKFRTMREATGPDGKTLPDEQRLTNLGRFLRATSLDELPELWNVLKGDMSLVGPRPLLIEYLSHYTPEQARRHEVRPGITGWAQINGRNTLSWEDKFKLDVWYVDNRSLWLDMKILFLTFFMVLERKGISADGHATMPPFHRSEGT